MGQLFQPTNIIPNVLGEFGNGVADVSVPLTISWQVNGTVPMTAYKIRCYANNGLGTYVDFDGTCDPPFYGRDSTGNVVRFSVPIETPSFMWQNGKDCAYDITQYWDGPSGTESITTLSKCIFAGRKTPSLQINTIPATVTSTSLLTEANYTQEQGDSLLWARWQLARVEGSEYKIVHDTGNLYGAQGTWLDYIASSVLMYNRTYALRCGIETENGATVITDWSSFFVTYDTTGGDVPTVKQTCDGGVAVSWPAYFYAPRTEASGEQSIIGDQLVMQAGATSSWSRTDGEDMNIPSSWTLVYRGIYPNTEGGEFGVTFGTDVKVYFQFANGDVIVPIFVNGSNLTFYPDISAGGPGTVLTVALTQGAFYVAIDGDCREYTTQTSAFDWRAIKSLYLKNAQNVQLFEIREGWLPFYSFKADYAGKPLSDLGGWSAGTWLKVFPNGQGTEAGRNTSGTEKMTGAAVFRYNTRNEDFSYVETVRYQTSRDTLRVTDYMATPRGGPYTYFLQEFFSDGASSTRNAGAISTEVSSCNMDWVLLSCRSNDQYTEREFVVEKTYLFSYNIESGGMSNNSKLNILENFTRYPTVQMSSVNHKSGTLRGLIGTVEGCQAEYSDTLEMRNELMGLATSGKTLFLKDRKGDLIRILPSGPVTINVDDATREQAQTIEFPWVEVDGLKDKNGNDISIIQIG